MTIALNVSNGPKTVAAVDQQVKTYTPKRYPTLPLSRTLSSLPPPYDVSGERIIEQIRAKVPSSSGHGGGDAYPTLVILDDDPTGTQTCHGIPVCLVWDHETLSYEFENSPRGFFILTNSRALPPSEAKELIRGIVNAVSKAADAAGRRFELVLRGDSTLRGHFPEEPEAAEEALGEELDGWILAPFFLQGGRYTIDDVHYVAEGDSLVPAAETPFAADASFGFRSSNLRDYIAEKAGGTKKDIVSVSIDDIRLGGPERVRQVLLGAKKGSVVIVNSAAESDMQVFAAGVLATTGKRFLYRTAAAFVSSRLGITPIPPLKLTDVATTTTSTSSSPSSSANGGLIIGGSYVPKTTAQLANLISRRGENLHVIELSVTSLLSSPEGRRELVSSAVLEASRTILSGKDTLVMTSRDLVKGSDAVSSLQIGGVIAASLVDLLKGVSVRPRYVIAKGGITSSDAASKGLCMRKATVVGQAAPGVPLWKCDEETSKFPGVPYVVFPGNVGTEETLADVVEAWSV